MFYAENEIYHCNCWKVNPVEVKVRMFNPVEVKIYHSLTNVYGLVYRKQYTNKQHVF